MDGLLNIDAIADAYWLLHHQPQCMDLRDGCTALDRDFLIDALKLINEQAVQSCTLRRFDKQDEISS